MDKKRVATYGLIALSSLVILFNLLPFVSADAITDFFNNVWSSWKGGEGIPVTFAKVLFAIIVGLLVYTVLDFIPGLENKTPIKVILAAVVAFLGTAYFRQEEVWVLLLSYSGMGFAIGAVFPFLILVAFSYKFIVDNQGIRNMWLKKSLLYFFWAMFGIFILWRIIDISGGSVSVSSAITLAHWIILGIVVIVLLFLSYIIKKVMKGEIEDITQRVQTATQMAAENELAQEEMARRLAGRRRR